MSGFLLGLVVVLSLFVVALEFTTRSADTDMGDDAINDLSQDIEMMPALQQKDMIAAAPTATPPDALNRINVIEDDVNEAVEDIPQVDTTADSDSDAAPGSGAGAGQADDASAQTQALSPVAVDKDDNPLNFQVVERLPEFPGGMVEFMKWLTKNLRYPVLAQQQKIQGKVLVAFIINKDGTITNQKVVTSVSPELDREALRVIRMMPKWKPGEDRGKPCRTYFCIPVVFKL